MRAEALVGHACEVLELKDALAEVDGLKSDIAGMAVIWRPRKVRFCSTMVS
jgi:hypothetical protein